ncbi:hypothetical protein L3Q82_022587 [Scortum barcoo]|uniref:Uncharacterized protein n=1 Tax=Scortum barcoo TaxID=214431 RepID=A0ACB8X2U8_9TELE|nr:hypothetical protein L3Q82_022587 [Scortum barcoo]
MSRRSLPELDEWKEAASSLERAGRPSKTAPSFLSCVMALEPSPYTWKSPPSHCLLLCFLGGSIGGLDQEQATLRDLDPRSGASCDGGMKGQLGGTAGSAVAIKLEGVATWEGCPAVVTTPSDLLTGGLSLPHPALSTKTHGVLLSWDVEQCSSPPPPPSPNLFTPTVDQVRTQLKKIKARKATGPDGISSRLLRDCADQLCQVVCYIFNLSLSLERVPVLWKTSCVVPVPKTSRPKELNHFRPVALTSHLMKALERIVLRHLRPLVSPNMDPLQFAYQPGIGVDDAVIYLEHLEDAGNTVRITFVKLERAQWGRFNRKRKRAEAVSRSSLTDTSSSMASTRLSSTMQLTDSQPLDCQRELCEDDIMIPLTIYNQLKGQHDLLLSECFNLRTKCDELKEENEQLKEALGSRFSFS